MKKVSFFLVLTSIFFLSASYDQSQEKYYYAFDEKIFLTEVPNMFVLSFDEKYLSDIQANLWSNVQIRDSELGFNNYILTTKENVTKRTFIEDLRRLPGMRSVNPMYATSEGALIPMTSEIVVQFKENVSQQNIDEIHKKYRLKVINIHRPTNTHYLFAPIDLDPLEVANAIQESGLANFSTPDFLIKVVH